MARTGNPVATERMPTSSVGNERPPRRFEEAGVTLLELVIVLVLLSLAVSLVAPRFGNWTDEWMLRSAAERVAQTLRYARTRAIYEQSYYVVEIDPKARLVRVLNPGSNFSREFTLPLGVRVEDRESLSSSVLRLLVPPSGVMGERNLWLSNRRGSTFRIHIDLLQGAPVVEKVKQGSH